MAAESFFVEFDIVLICALLAGILSIKLKMPPVINMLFVGMIIGPNVLGIVKESSIGMLSEIGAILLLLMVGVEFSISKLLSTGLRAVIAGTIIVFGSFLSMYAIATELGFDFITSLYLGAMFCFSSTAIIIKILEQKGMLKRKEVPFLIAVLIIEDLVAIFFLTFFSSLKAGGLASGDIIKSIVVSLAIIFFTYAVMNKIFQKFSDFFIKYQAEENMVFFSLALALGMSIVAAILNLAPSIGAFLAGSLIAKLPNGKSFEKSIRPFALLFSSFFFLSVGLMIDPKAIAENIGATSIIIISGMLVIFFITLIAVYLVGSSGRAAVASGLIMLPIGEFSLLIAKESSGLASINLVGIASLAALVTATLASILVNKDKQIYSVISGILSENTKSFIRSAASYFSNTISAFEPKGVFYEILLKESKRIFLNSAVLVVASIAIWVSGIFLDFNIVGFGISMKAYTPLLLLAIILSIIPSFRIAFSVAKIAETFFKVTTWTTNKNAAVKILRKIFLGILLVLVALNIPAINNLAGFPPLFDLILLPLAIIGALFIWSGIKEIPQKAGKLFRKHVDIFKEDMVCEKNDILCIPRKIRIKRS